MFESSFLEMLLVGIVALLVIGPERLPTVARTLGQWVGKIRRFIAKARADVDRELHTDELRTMFQKQEEELRTMRSMMQEKTAAMNQTVRKELEQHDKPN